MIQDEIIEMARKTKMPFFWGTGEVANLHKLEHFAKLVAAKEREIYMQLFLDPENQPTQYGTVTVEFMNREIAKKQEDIIQIIKETSFSNWFQADVIEAIKARGEA